MGRPFFVVRVRGAAIRVWQEKAPNVRPFPKNRDLAAETTGS